MKTKIKVKELVKGCLPKIIKKGEWIDLHASKDIKLECMQAEILKRHKDKSYREVNFKWEMIPLGIAVKLPKGYEAVVAPRSSTFKHWYVLQTNSVGVIDNSYSGNKDEWHMPILALENGVIHKGERICQFRIQLSQKANFWTKLKWLFSNGVKIVQVEELDNTPRGGFGSTGLN
jgi:dUTP pyrophosphatase